MTFTVTIEGFCAGGEHVSLTIHPQSGGDYPAVTTKEELLTEAAEDTIRDRIAERIRFFCLENWNGSLVDLKNAIEAATFKV